MTIMPFEGLMSESVEDVFGFGIVSEPTHTDEDETYYVTSILSGEHDEDEADREGEYMTDEDYSEDDWRIGQDRWERSFWGD